MVFFLGKPRKDILAQDLVRVGNNGNPPVVSAEEIINGRKKVAQRMGRAVDPVEVETTLRASAEGRNNAKRLTHVSTAKSNSGQSHT